MVVRIGERRHGEQAGRPGGRRLDRGDQAVFDGDGDGGRAAVVGEKSDAVKFHFAWGSSMTLTWAATIRQPSGSLAQLCIWRPTLPGALARRNRVAAIAKSRP